MSLRTTIRGYGVLWEGEKKGGTSCEKKKLDHVDHLSHKQIRSSFYPLWTSVLCPHLKLSDYNRSLSEEMGIMAA